MRTVIGIALFLAACAGTNSSSGALSANTATEAGPVQLVTWGSTDGVRRLAESQFKVDFFSLANHFQPQITKTFCGVASATIVLNSLRLRKAAKPLPLVALHLSEGEAASVAADRLAFHRYSQRNVFVEGTKTALEVMGKPTVVDGKETRQFGFQLQQLRDLLAAHGLKASAHVVAPDLPAAKIHEDLVRNLATKDDYVIVNYDRRALGQPGGGHISPLGAYHAPTDSFLILDTNPNKADWVWVTASDLIRAMRSFDTLKNRGYLLVADDLAVSPQGRGVGTNRGKWVLRALGQ